MAGNWGTIAGMIAAISTTITAVGGIYLGRRVQDVGSGVRDVHTIVNQQRTNMLQYQKVLKLALSKAGIEVPDDQSELE